MREFHNSLNIELSDEVFGKITDDFSETEHHIFKLYHQFINTVRQIVDKTRDGKIDEIESWISEHLIFEGASHDYDTFQNMLKAFFRETILSYVFFASCFSPLLQNFFLTPAGGEFYPPCRMSDPRMRLLGPS